MQKTEIVEIKHFIDDVDGAEASAEEPGGNLMFVDPDTKRLKSIDLVGKRYDETYNLLDDLIPYARDVNPDEVLTRGRTRKARSGSKPSGKRAENAALREWARSTGHAVGDRGAIPKHLWEAWEQAGRPGM